MKSRFRVRGLLAPYFENPAPLRSCGLAAAGILGIAITDWIITPNISLGIFYLFPIVLAAPVLRFPYIVLLAILCSGLRELFAPFAGHPGMAIRLPALSFGFSSIAWLVAELVRSRRLVVQHVKEKEAEMARRLAVEHELAAVVDTSPLAILIADERGRIAQANSSAERLLMPSGGSLVGCAVGDYLPLPARGDAERLRLRTRIECRARRGGGEPFLAYVWAAAFGAGKTALVVWDGTDDLRDREGAGFDSLMTTSRILLGGISHEIRNFVAAARESHRRLGRAADVHGAPDYQSLGLALQRLDNAASSGLRLATERCNAVADLRVVFDETRILKQPGLEDDGVAVEWPEPAGILRVRGDQQALVQVFVNLLRNSRLALSGSGDDRRIVITTESRDGSILIRLSDNGPGIAHPEQLFDVFQPGARTGLGLYLSRCLVLSFGGDLRYDRAAQGATFVVELQSAELRS